MAEFLKGSEINSALEEIFRKAEKNLTLISPYIKLHQKLKDILITHLNKPELLITIVFGKNKDSLEKSLNKSDFDFVTKFENVEILYHERLHAKFYQNDWQSILTSMNLYDYSQNNNIEFGILTENKLFNNLDKKASEYFEEILKSCDLLYSKVPQYETSYMGIKNKYISSKIEVDKLTHIYSPEIKTFTQKFESKKIDTTTKYISTTALSKAMNMQSKELFELLNKKDWITKQGDSWKLTNKGIEIGGVVKNGQYGEYIAWNEDITNKIGT